GPTMLAGSLEEEFGPIQARTAKERRGGLGARGYEPTRAPSPVAPSGIASDAWELGSRTDPGSQPSCPERHRERRLGARVTNRPGLPAQLPRAASRATPGSSGHEP